MKPTPKPPLVLRSLLAVLLATWLAGCVSSTSAARHGQVEHVVLVWLKQPDDRATFERMCTTARSFEGVIPGLLSVNLGQPVPADGPLTDASFHLGMVMRFRDRQALADYAVHPVHQQAVAEVLLPNSARVLVYDVEVR